MIIEVNSLSLGSNSDYKLAWPIEGLGTPPIRTSSDNYSGRDGGVVTGQFYSPRLISFNGFIIGTTCQQHEELRMELEDALPIRSNLDVVITTFSGNEYTASVRVVDVQLEQTGPKSSRFKVDLFASDPNLYINTLQSVTVPKDVGGGFILPVIFPIVFDAGTTPTIVTNNGSVAVYPILTVSGTATNPRFVHEDTGEEVQVLVTLGGTDELEIDMFNRTITLNGGSVISFRTDASDWFDLNVGVNHLSYETDSGGDTGIATVSWRAAVIGI